MLITAYVLIGLGLLGLMFIGIGLWQTMRRQRKNQEKKNNVRDIE